MPYIGRRIPFRSKINHNALPSSMRRSTPRPRKQYPVETPSLLSTLFRRLSNTSGTLIPRISRNFPKVAVLRPRSRASAFTLPTRRTREPLSSPAPWSLQRRHWPKSVRPYPHPYRPPNRTAPRNTSLCLDLWRLSRSSISSSAVLVHRLTNTLKARRRSSRLHRAFPPGP